jgi:iron complex outermembrane recepter protein
LSVADAALGYTAGRITKLHFGLINGGRTVTDSVDVQWEWTLPPIPYGQVRLYGAATWQARFRTRTRLGGPMIERSGYLDGPLPLQGYAGAEWIRGALSLDLNVQVNDRRHVTSRREADAPLGAYPTMADVLSAHLAASEA